ncbi:Fe2+-enterobactin ABC transporter substrate-binding protein [uncultured Microbacterium sp.]|uniref:Fe2+-enterobactin ABC transporter substrate-binding protein n=1 Tax=uncultured Microbacterium sp. TaxID=191216 RepID=UPI002614D499|nr:Fe2+-enterobactin ABC transporter substrate-binding protein [uncultured Microbacterium sp.]
MSHAISTRSRLLGGLAILSVGALALSGCAASGEAEENTSTENESAAGEWPRTFENADGTTTEIPAQPKNIVSTSVSTSGTLLAFDAPVVASGSAGNGQFFSQWSDVADERGVENLWAAGEVDLEAVYAYEPDLIVVSSSGADSVADQVAELQEIAPTIVVDYGGQSWQELAAELGEATGMEIEAEAAVADFDTYVAEAADSITVPAGEANIISFNGAGDDNPIARAGGAQGQLLTALGFTIEDPNTEWHTQDNTRADFVWAPFERLTELTGDTTFILSQDDEGAQAFAQDPVLANVPSVKAGQVYGLGKNSFRIDMYSATEIVDGIVANFGK